MAIKKRDSRKPLSADEFIEAAESVSQDTLSTNERLEKRSVAGRAFQLMVLRGTEPEKALIEYAAKKEGLSMQQLVRSVLFRELEERYGSEVPLT